MDILRVLAGSGRRISFPLLLSLLSHSTSTMDSTEKGYAVLCECILIGVTGATLIMLLIL